MAPDQPSEHAPPRVQGLYVPAKRLGDMIFVSGMTPRTDGRLIQTGQIVPGDDPECYRTAVELAARNALAAAGTVLTEGEELYLPLSLTVYLNTTPDYTEHSKIADFASALLAGHFDGEIPSRTAVGVASLPGGAPVELSLIISARRR